jgi:hypothetical protein
MYVNETGLPSVTDVLSCWVDRRWFTEESCIRGDQAHERISSHLTFEFIMDFDEKYEVYFKSFQQFEPRIKEVVLVEERLADYDLGYCGQPDLVFLDVDDMLALADWKTGKAVTKYWPIQLGGYSMLLKSQKNISVRKNIIVRLRDDEAKKPLINVYCVEECERLFTNQLELFKLMGGKKK